jgi:hypothetical protein
MSERRPSFRAAFRQAPWLLRLAFSICVGLLSLLLLEGMSWVVLEARFGGKPQPRFLKELSGFQVFDHTPDYTLGPLIDPAPGEPPLKTDAQGLISDDPVVLPKPAGTLRVILTGGSTAAGCGQLKGRGYEDVRSYPAGIYAWSGSLAGRLERALQAAFPERQVQVVNAAYYQKTFHQSLVHYLTVLSRLEPDLVLSVDGYNDHELFLSDPYEQLEARWLGPYADLHHQTHRDLRSNTRALLEGALRTYAPGLAP